MHRNGHLHKTRILKCILKYRTIIYTEFVLFSNLMILSNSSYTKACLGLVEDTNVRRKGQDTNYCGAGDGLLLHMLTQKRSQRLDTERYLGVQSEQ